MDDFRLATALSPKGTNRWSAELLDDWALWGPAGGFLSAIALRGAGEATSFDRPVSFSCQFLSLAKFESIDVHVTSLRIGKRSEALRVDLTQNDRLILTANVWTSGADVAQEAMEHDYCNEMVVPTPSTLKSYAELYPDRPVHPFMSRMEQYPINPIADGDLMAREPEKESLFRWKGGLTAEQAFIDGGRAMMLMDTHAWLATYAAHPTNGPSPWIAPNLDYYYQFHRPTQGHEWLYMKNRADLACDSMISTQGEIRDLQGRMLVRGYAQLMCSRRPEQFR